jgi:hypothetical protein
MVELEAVIVGVRADQLKTPVRRPDLYRKPDTSAGVCALRQRPCAEVSWAGQ